MEKLTLQTNRLILNSLEYGDVDDIIRCCSNKKVYSTLLHIPNPYTFNEGRKFIQKGRKALKELKNKAQFAIRLKENKQFVGTISLNFSLKQSNGEIGYWLDPDFWGRGFMTEATKAVAEFAFNELNLHKLVITAYSSNVASCKIAQKLGFKFEGCQKEQFYYDGSYKDANNYGLVNPNQKHKKRKN